MDFTHAVVEQLGHRRFVGRVVETSIAGATMLRVEVADALADDGTVVYRPPVYLGGASLFAVTPTTEEAICEEFRREAERQRLQAEAEERWRRQHALAPAVVEAEEAEPGAEESPEPASAATSQDGPAEDIPW